MNTFLNGKTNNKILHLNKQTFKTIIITSMILSLIRGFSYIIYSESFGFIEQLIFFFPTAILLYMMSKVNSKINDTKTVEEFDYHFMYLFIVLLITMFMSSIVRSIVGIELCSIKNIKQFYRITTVTMIYISSKTTVENKWLGIIYKAYFISMFSALVNLIIKESLEDIFDDLLVGIFQIVVSKSIYDTTISYSKEFKKLLIKNEINIERLINIFNNIKQSCLISINLSCYNIDVNDEFGV